MFDYLEGTLAQRSPSRLVLDVGGVGYEIADIEPATAEWLLEWCAFRLRDRDDFPRLDLTSDSGFSISLGSAGEPIAIGGTSANLLGWLMSRVDASAVRGDDGLQLPAF